MLVNVYAYEISDDFLLLALWGRDCTYKIYIKNKTKLLWKYTYGFLNLWHIIIIVNRFSLSHFAATKIIENDIELYLLCINVN